MKILKAHKFYHIVGESERYYFDLMKLLSSHGHQIIGKTIYSRESKRKIERLIRACRTSLRDSKREQKVQDLGKEVYRKPPWAIYKKGDSWIYTGSPSSIMTIPEFCIH